MGWRVEFLPAADKAFGKLDRQQQRRILELREFARGAGVSGMNLATRDG